MKTTSYQQPLYLERVHLGNARILAESLGKTHSRPDEIMNQSMKRPRNLRVKG
jgi:hypothetical protein